MALKYIICKHVQVQDDAVRASTVVAADKGGVSSERSMDALFGPSTSNCMIIVPCVCLSTACCCDTWLHVEYSSATHMQCIVVLYPTCVLNFVTFLPFYVSLFFPFFILLLSSTLLFTLLHGHHPMHISSPCSSLFSPLPPQPSTIPPHTVPEGRLFEGLVFTLAAIRGTPEEETARQLIKGAGGRLFDLATMQLAMHSRPIAVCPPSLTKRHMQQLGEGASTRDFRHGRCTDRGMRVGAVALGGCMGV